MGGIAVEASPSRARHCDKRSDIRGAHSVIARSWRMDVPCRKFGGIDDMLEWQAPQAR